MDKNCRGVHKLYTADGELDVIEQQESLWHIQFHQGYVIAEK